MKNYLREFLSGKKVLILGYGREGKSTLNYLNANIPDTNITVADRNESAFISDLFIQSGYFATLSGNEYPDDLTQFDIIIKSPGISLNNRNVIFNAGSITSQTDLFLAVYGKQTIGITGTKGKSTTSSLIYHILQSGNQPVLFGGNIGTPLFDLIEKITPETRIVAELSSHQLEYSSHAPHIGILLNLYQEHLDHYNSYIDYQKAKYNIALYQDPDDYFIYSAEDPLIMELIANYPAKGVQLPYNKGNCQTTGIGLEGEEIILKNAGRRIRLLPGEFKLQLPGDHNRSNAVIAAAAAALSETPSEDIRKAISTFKPLEHRLEYIGTIHTVKYYNDSISTIPEAAIAAVESLKPVDTLILGGFDRGIDYSVLINYLSGGFVKKIVTTGPAGWHIYNMLLDHKTKVEAYYFDTFDVATKKAIEITPISGLCLLSPAASSYNEFKNFEERGRRFREIVLQSK